MVRWSRILALVLLAFTCWALWRTHAWEGASLVPTAILLGIILLGVSAAALWHSPSRYRRNWVTVFPWITVVLCIALFLGQVMATYTTWVR
jgi:hypothetical protein